jgi:glucose-1-phosphatase
MVQLKGIKNIIFDLGEVIINLSPQSTVSAFQELLKDTYIEMEKELHSKKVLNKFETGEISTEGFTSFFKTYKPKLSDQEIIDAWNSMLLDIPEERLNVIKKLGKRYRLFLLSNTNGIHLNYINRYVKNEFSMEAMSMPFEKAYYSHQMGCRKPDSKIFETILIEQNILPDETLFIDDSEQHILAAKKLNLKTHHLLEPETILDIFNVN